MSDRKRGLGRGLEALIPPGGFGEEYHIDAKDRVLLLDVNSLAPNRFQPRKEFDAGKLEELASSIKEHGVVQPIVVRGEENGDYEIVAGERRWRACQLLGLDKIPAVVKEYSNRQLTEIALIENIQREDLNPLEEANAYEMLIEEFDFTQEELAQKIGKSRPFVANTLRLLQLEKEVQTMLEKGLLSGGHARALLSLKGREQKTAAERVTREGLNVRQTEVLVRNLLQGGESARSSASVHREETLSAEEGSIRRIIADVEESLKERLGTQVRIRGKEKGRIEIEYYSAEDMERILELILNPGWGMREN